MGYFMPFVWFEVVQVFLIMMVSAGSAAQERGSSKAVLRIKVSLQVLNLYSIANQNKTLLY
jgi:hypothetical protein